MYENWNQAFFAVFYVWPPTFELVPTALQVAGGGRARGFGNDTNTYSSPLTWELNTQAPAKGERRDAIYTLPAWYFMSLINSKAKFSLIGPYLSMQYA